MTQEKGFSGEVFPVYRLLRARGLTTVIDASLVKIESCRPIWDMFFRLDGSGMKGESK